MTGWMKAKFYPINHYRFVVSETLHLNIGSNSNLQNGFCKVMTQVFLHSPLCVITVTVGNYRQIDGSPRIQIEFSGDAINAFVREFDKFQNRLVLSSKLEIFGERMVFIFHKSRCHFHTRYGKSDSISAKT